MLTNLLVSVQALHMHNLRQTKRRTDRQRRRHRLKTPSHWHFGEGARLNKVPTIRYAFINPTLLSVTVWQVKRLYNW